MDIIQSPTEHDTIFTKDRLFLAGGISNCPDWQYDICTRLKQKSGDVTVYNPRRIGDLAFNTEDAREQILWEHRHLIRSTHMLFWFPKETLCPITLFELGKHTARFFTRYPEKPRLFVGMHPEYARRFDLEVQLPLMIPAIKLYYSLDDLFDAVVDGLKLA